MTLKWSPDTCDCVLMFNPNSILPNNLVSAEKCKIHESLTGPSLVNVVINHNRSFNLKFGNKILTNEEKAEIKVDKRKEKMKSKTKQ